MFWYIIWGLIVAYGVYLLVLLWLRRSSATMMDASQFGEDLRHVQLVDLREKDEYRRAHILGARNIPYSQFKVRMSELRKDQPVYLYDQGVQVSGRAAYKLKKAGFEHIAILKNGFEGWSGKIKRDKYSQ